MQYKNSGAAVLLVSVILSGLILTVGLGLTRLLSTELQFSADLMLGERAYFAAESGVETALWALQNEPDNAWQDPVNYVTADTISGYQMPDGSSSFSLAINARESIFTEPLPPQSPLKLLLRNDAAPGLPTTLFSIQSLGISRPEDQPNPLLDWKILCPSDTGTIALQSIGLSPADSLISFSQMHGVRDDGTNPPQPMDAFTFLEQQDNAGCYLSITNFGNVDTALTFETHDGMAPAAPHVTARGMAGNREKVVSFQYRQKNLSELFGFGLFHED